MARQGGWRILHAMLCNRPLSGKIKAAEETKASGKEATVSDVFTPYESALEELLDRLGKEHEKYIDALTLQSGLLESINAARLEGDTEGRRAERRRIEKQLNKLALAELGISFNELAFPEERPAESGAAVVQPVVEPERALPAVIEPYQPFEPEMVLIPAGDLLMGSDPAKDKDAQDIEQPQHRLYLPDYYMARTPVTNAQYAAFVRAGGGEPPKHWEEGDIPPGKDDHPAVNVTWHDAVAYCRWLSEITGKSCNLPSEAEWEKAARGTDGRIYPWGDEWDSEKCNSEEGGPGGTTPVGAYPEGASPYDLLDMAGNVWEWTRSLWGKSSKKPDYGYPYDPGDRRREALDAPADVDRVMRGGSWYFDLRYARCASRGWLPPVLWDSHIGFRVVLSRVLF